MWTVDGEIDSLAGPVGPQRLPMRTNGVGLVFTCFLIYAGIAAMGAAGSVAFLVQAFTKTPGECEAGWVGGVALSVSFMSLGYIFGSLAFRGIRASIRANRDAGGVILERDALVIDSPGILASPATIHRAWISTIETAGSSGPADGASLTLSIASRFTLIRLRQPIGLRSAVGAPGFLSVVSINPPHPWQQVKAIAVALEDPTASQAALIEWLARPPVGCAPPIPQPTTRDRTRMYRMVAAIVLGLAGLGVLVLAIPTGPSC